MLSANSSRALAPIVSMEVMRVGSLFLVLAAVPCRRRIIQLGQKNQVLLICSSILYKQRDWSDFDLQSGVKLRLVHLQVSEDGEDGEDGRVVVAHDGSASCRHNVVSLQHQVVQRLLWTDEGTRRKQN